MNKHFCKLCGKEILNRHQNAQYCLDCSDAMVGMPPSVRAEYSESVRKNTQKQSKPVRRARRSDGYTIEQIVKLAAEANMTYGEYVQKMEEGLV